jgi:hypothetical protein
MPNRAASSFQSRIRTWPPFAITASWQPLALTHDGRYLAAACTDGRIVILRLKAAGEKAP